MDEKELLEEIKNNLTIEQIEELLINLDADPQVQGNFIKARTICHCGNSHKLYYYDNTHLFKCFTECDSTFDVFELIIKVKKGAGLEIALPQAIQYILNFFNLGTIKDDFQLEELEDWKILKKYDKNNIISEDKQIIQLKNFNDNFLKFLPHPRILPWEKEGISLEIMNRNHICYNSSSQAIVIPHYDKDNNLIGIRERTLIKENETNGKYKPMILNGKMYNHPLFSNLYNLNNSKDNIKNIKKAIIFEGEKSCLLYASYFGSENDISVAVCGSSLGSYQVQLLLDLGIEEMIIALDKQFQEIGDEE